MSGTTLHIKHMVCPRCIRSVREELAVRGYTVRNIELGKVDLEEALDQKDLQLLRDALLLQGFEIIDDRKGAIVNRIKSLIIEYIHHDKELPGHVNFSTYLSGELGYDYSYLSNLFSSVEGRTIEKFLILQKIEKVKELLIYDDQSLSEISFQLVYSSVQHLSRQFKEVTGLTPSAFKKLNEKKRKGLDAI